MKAGLFFRLLFCAFVSVLLAGCSTPQPILDLAGHGASTIALTELSLRDYIAASQARLSARRDQLRVTEQRDVRDKARSDFDAFIDSLADTAPDDRAASRVRALGEERRRWREQTAAELKAVEKKYSADPAATPQVPTEKLAAAKKSIAILAEELSPDEWVKLSAGYVREIRKEVKKLRDEPTPSPAGGN